MVELKMELLFQDGASGWEKYFKKLCCLNLSKFYKEILQDLWAAFHSYFQCDIL
jgi:hypothetical protein